MSHPILPNVMGLVRGLPGVFFCQTGVVLTKFQPFRGLPAAFRERFLSNAGGFDKIPTVSELVRGLFRVFFVKRGWF